MCGKYVQWGKLTDFNKRFSAGEPVRMILWTGDVHPTPSATLEKFLDE
jgi:hypothetical protein